MNPESLARETRRPTSLNDFLEQFEAMANEKREVTWQLNQARDEIENLRTQLGSRLDSLLSTKEKLIREEFERKYQELVVEVRRERTKHGQQIKHLNEQLSACICHRTKPADPFWNSIRQRTK
jgi:DNA repair ATPase RecN